MIDPEIVEVRSNEDARICEALRFSGVELHSIFDLVNTRASYPELIPVLLNLLPTVKDSWIKQAVVRALTVKEARGLAGKALLREFRLSPSETSFTWAVGNALSVVATRDDFDDIAALLVDKRYGTGRQMLASALVRADKSRTEPILLSLLDDEDVLPHVIRELGKLRSKSAVPRLNELLEHPKQLVRSEAKKALRRIASA